MKFPRIVPWRKPAAAPAGARAPLVIDPPAPADEKPTLTVGAMSSRFRHPVTRTFLREIGIEPAAIVAGQWLYLESRWPAIRRAVAANALTAGEQKASSLAAAPWLSR